MTRPTASLVRALALSLLVLTGCSGDDDGPTSVDEEFRGTWVNEEGTEFYVITGNALTVHQQANEFGCFVAFEFDLEPEGGSSFTATDESGDLSYDVEMERVGDDLQLTFDGNEVELSATDEDPSLLQHCVDGVIDCSDLPALTIPGSFDGFLSSTDLEDENGAYVDGWALELGAMTNVQVSMGTSAGYDTWLGIYDEQGQELATDPGTPFSTIQISMPAGCYVVMASSVEAGMTGSYILNTSTF